jgi:hypothetical protein
MNVYALRHIGSAKDVGRRDCEHSRLSRFCLCRRPALDQASAEEGEMIVEPVCGCGAVWRLSHQVHFAEGLVDQDLAVSEGVSIQALAVRG